MRHAVLDSDDITFDNNGENNVNDFRRRYCISHPSVPPIFVC